jgi:hypothetical protein
MWLETPTVSTPEVARSCHDNDPSFGGALRGER